MQEVVTVEFRGTSDALAPGDTLVVESCEAGVLRLRRTLSPMAVLKATLSERAVVPPAEEAAKGSSDV